MCHTSSSPLYCLMMTQLYIFGCYLLNISFYFVLLPKLVLFPSELVITGCFRIGGALCLLNLTSGRLLHSPPLLLLLLFFFLALFPFLGLLSSARRVVGNFGSIVLSPSILSINIIIDIIFFSITSVAIIIHTRSMATKAPSFEKKARKAYPRHVPVVSFLLTNVVP